MATATLTLTNVKQTRDADGKKVVEATVDFDTGDYTANGLVLGGAVAAVAVTYPIGSETSGLTATTTVNTGGGLLAALGFKQIDEMYVRASRSVNAPYTQAQWVTANDTKTIAYFLDNATNGTPQIPLLVLYVGDNVHGASAIDGSAQFRARFIGS